MKKIILFFSFTILFFSMQAQTEISGYLDNTPGDGIGGTASTYAFQAAIHACRTLVHDGKSDWYLPSLEELVLFVNELTSGTTTPGCTGSNCNWTSNACWARTFSGNLGSFEVATFEHTSNTQSGVFRYKNYGSGYVRCVR